MKTTARPASLVALVTLSALVITGCSGADAQTQAVEDHHAVCVDENTGAYVDLSQCYVLDDDGDMDDRDDYDASMGMTAASGVVLGAVAASLLKGTTPSAGQKAHSYVRTVPAEANLITPQGVLVPGTGDHDKRKAKKSTPAPAKATPAKAQEEKQSFWKKSAPKKKASKSRRGGKR